MLTGFPVPATGWPIGQAAAVGSAIMATSNNTFLKRWGGAAGSATNFSWVLLGFVTQEPPFWYPYQLDRAD